MTQRNTGKIREECIKKIERCDVIINGLKGSTPFQMLLEDYKRSLEFVENTWHTVPLDQWSQLNELKVSKMAALSIINVLEVYKLDRETAAKTLASIDNPELVQNSYVDQE